MAETKLKGTNVHLEGNLPTTNEPAPDFRLVDADLNDVHLSHFKHKRKLIATVPSLDTDVCSQMARHLNAFAKKHPHIEILVVSTDLPFAQKRFCGTENVHNIKTLSMMRDKSFGKDYGLLIKDGPLAGILARALIVLDEKDHIVLAELAPEITQEPNYSIAEKALLHS